MKNVHRSTLFTALGLFAALSSFGCGPAFETGEAANGTGTSSAALTAGSAPVTATINDGVGAAGALLSTTQAEVAAKLGAGSCQSAVSSKTQTCTYRSADGVVRATAIYDTSSPRLLAALNTPLENKSWKTLKGISVGSTEAAFNAAYGSSIDNAQSSSYSKVVAGVDSLGRPSLTRFGLGWFNEYQSNQYFGVTSMSVALGNSTPPPTGGSTAPVVATINEGVGAGGANLGMTQSEVAAVLGIPFACSKALAIATQSCTYKSADGVVRAVGVFSGSWPRRLTSITVSSNGSPTYASWKTLKGIAVRDIEAAVTSAYGSAIDATRSDFNVKVVLGVDATGAQSETRFSLGWFNEYFPDQYRGVYSISVNRR